MSLSSVEYIKKELEQFVIDFPTTKIRYENHIYGNHYSILIINLNHRNLMSYSFNTPKM